MARKNEKSPPPSFRAKFFQKRRPKTKSRKGNKSNGCTKSLKSREPRERDTERHTTEKQDPTLRTKHREEPETNKSEREKGHDRFGSQNQAAAHFTRTKAPAHMRVSPSRLAKATLSKTTSSRSET